MSVLRCQEPGWIEIGQADPSGRRSLWVRFNAVDGIVSSFELCAGREGDDAYAVIGRGNPAFVELAEVLRYAQESARQRREETAGASQPPEREGWYWAWPNEFLAEWQPVRVFMIQRAGSKDRLVVASAGDEMESEISDWTWGPRVEPPEAGR